MWTIKCQLQENFNKIETWATSNENKFSKSKTQCVHFCQLRKQHDDPVLHLYVSPLPVVEESKFLCIALFLIENSVLSPKLISQS